METPAAIALNVSEEAERSWSLKMIAPLEPAIVCLDMERMLKFYTDVLGFKLVADVEAKPEMGAKIHISPHGYRIVRLQTPYGERIKLAQPKVPPKQNPICDYVCECRGYAWLSFIVSNMDEVLSRLNAHKLDIISEGLVEVREGVLALFIKDPEGNFVEIVYYSDIASYRPDLFRK